MAIVFRSPRSLQALTRTRFLTPYQPLFRSSTRRLNSSTSSDPQPTPEDRDSNSDASAQSTSEASELKSDDQLAKKDAQIAEYKVSY